MVKPLPLPPMAQKSGSSYESKKLPFWGSKALDGTVVSKMRLNSCKKEVQGQILPPLQTDVTVGEWRTLGQNYPGILDAHRVSPPDVTRRGRNKWRQAQSPQQASPREACPKEAPRQDVSVVVSPASPREAPVCFFTDHARDAALVDPMSVRVREAARASCALCGDEEELERMYHDADEYVHASLIKRMYGLHGKVSHLGTELLSCIKFRYRPMRSVAKAPNNGLPPQPPAHGILSWMPCQVKKSYFYDIVREEMDERRLELDRLKTHRTVFVTSDSGASRSSSRRPSKNSPRLSLVDQVHDGQTDLKAHDLSSTPSRNKLSVLVHNSPRASLTVAKSRPSVKPTILNQPLEIPVQQNILSEACSATRSLRQRHVFERLSEDSRIHAEDLLMAIKLLGFPEIREEWAEECALSVTKMALLNEREFNEFVKQYTERQEDAQYYLFCEYDTDRSGTIDSVELAQLLASAHIAPMTHVVAEVFADVDADKVGALSFRQVLQVLDIISLQEGFTKAEYDNFVEIFDRFCGEDNEMCTNILAAVMHWYGFLVSPHTLDRIVYEVDVDDSGTINQVEFLACMRHVRISEMETLRRYMRETTGDVETPFILQLFQCLGYIPDAYAVAEVAADIGHAFDDERLYDLSKLWQLMQMYRKREGISKIDAEEVERAFHRHVNTAHGHHGSPLDKTPMSHSASTGSSRSRAVSSMPKEEQQTSSKGHGDRTQKIALQDVGKVLRSIGYVITFDMQQALSANLDLNHCGKLDLQEMKKLVRMVRAEDLKLAKTEFDLYKHGEQHIISCEDARHALDAMGCVQPDGSPVVIQLKDMVKGGLDIYGFCAVVMRNRKEMRALYVKNGGFSNEDLETLKKNFAHFDTDGSGDICKKELTNLIEKLMPKYAYDPDLRPTLIKLMQEVDENGDDQLDFEEFVRLVRRVHDFETMARVSKEAMVVEETGFSAHEVQGFRDIFVKQACGLRELPFGEVKAIMSGICPMGAKHTEEFQVILRQIVKCPLGREDQPDKDLNVDFPDFIRLMRQIINSNFGQVQGRFGLKAPSNSSPTKV
jgi:Ca2+-binding EF-hand superfamily protein